MKSKKNNIEISEKDVDEQLVDIPIPQPTKQKKILTPEQLENLKKARERASERKKELAQLNAKSKGLKEEKLKADAAEYDKLQKQKELEESIKKIEEANAKPPQKKTEHHKKIKKIIYEDDTENENSSVEEVIKCDQGAINIVYANYGRTSSNICRRPPFNNLKCLSDQSRYIFDLCNGLMSCNSFLMLIISSVCLEISASRTSA